MNTKDLNRNYLFLSNFTHSIKITFYMNTPKWRSSPNISWKVWTFNTMKYSSYSSSVETVSSTSKATSCLVHSFSLHLHFTNTLSSNFRMDARSTEFEFQKHVTMCHISITSSTANFFKLIKALSRSLSLDTLNMRLSGKGVSLIIEFGSLSNINSLAILETVETVAVAVKPKNYLTNHEIRWSKIVRPLRKTMGFI
ncbi:hypothetical protein AGLY_013538 [Aphis glycines]|uniref:Uncharacterized protein n=1 Tax=Aphis glycines TaxID=307491 RepID=A0A6G0T6Y6_APHGL|nr:hypothetical protein AGLY_013538 [Aphis glycines]